MLQRAVEIEEHRPGITAATRGLTLGELHEIAREVGLSPAVIDEALSTLQTGRRSHASGLLGAPLSRKVVRAVPRNLDEDGLRRLIRITEDSVDATGTVSEALGTVRWTSVSSAHKFAHTTQISLSSNSGETQIQVAQRYPAGLRAVLHFIPAAWGAMLGAGVAASTGAIGMVGVGVAAAALGIGIGRGIWQLLARRSERQVEEVATALANAASDITEA